MNRRRQDRRITSTFSRAGNEHHATRAAEYSGGPCTYKVSRILERVPPDLRFRCPLDAKSFVRGPKIDPPGAPGTVFDLNAHLVVIYVRLCFFNGSPCKRKDTGTGGFGPDTQGLGRGLAGGGRWPPVSHFHGLDVAIGHRWGPECGVVLRVRPR